MPDQKNNKGQSSKPSKSVFLAQVLQKEIEEVLSKFTNGPKQMILEHMILLFKDLEAHALSQDPAIYDSFAKRETDLFKKYGKVIEPYRLHYFYKLFHFEVLVEKRYYTAEEFNALPNEETALSKLDVQQVCRAIGRFLDGELERSYFENSDTKAKDEGAAPAVEGLEKDHEATEARRLLVVHVLLKAGFGVEHNEGNDVSAFARMAHLLLGKSFTTLQKSTIYEKYKKMPYYRSDENLIGDLKYIKPFFEKLFLQKAIELIDTELEAAIKRLPADKRKEYR
jgi:hypothetical protein